MVTAQRSLTPQSSGALGSSSRPPSIPIAPASSCLTTRVDIERIPPGDRIETEAQRAQLILHPTFISPGQAAEVAEEDAAGQLMERFADVELGPDHPLVLLDMDDLE